MHDLLREAQHLSDTMVKDRRWLHRHAETGYNLLETTSYVRKRLEGMGYVPREIVKGGLACVAGDTAGPCFLLRADMDALPEAEKTDLSFAATNGNMHACGHDLHTAMLLGAAQIVKDHETEFGGCVKIMFQPDEEATDQGELLGNQAMIDAGILEEPRVGAASALHLCPTGIPDGEVGVISGTAFFSVDDVDVVVRGTCTHGAQPQKGIDPLNIMAHIYLGMQEVIAREVDPLETVVMTFGTIKGGTAANVIPETVHMLGTLRTDNEETRGRLHGVISRIVTSTAAAFGGTADVRFLRGLPTVYNDPGLTKELCAYYEAGTGKRALHLDKPFSGSDDFGTMSHKLPVTYFLLGSTPEGGCEVPLHNPHIVFDEAIMPVGAALHASVAMGWLEERARECK